MADWRGWQIGVGGVNGVGWRVQIHNDNPTPEKQKSLISFVTQAQATVDLKEKKLWNQIAFDKIKLKLVEKNLKPTEESYKVFVSDTASLLNSSNTSDVPQPEEAENSKNRNTLVLPDNKQHLVLSPHE